MNETAKAAARTDAETTIDEQGKKLGMWLFLYTELLFFGGMFILYAVFRSRFPAEFHQGAKGENLLLGSLNTFILLTSSCTLALALANLRGGRSRYAALLQGTTALFGIMFLTIKFFEWREKILLGIYPASSVLDGFPKGEILFFNLYFVMTGIHGLHVLIGVCVIAVMFSFTLRGSLRGAEPAKLENTALYWHFVDIVWIYLFPLFYLIT